MTPQLSPASLPELVDAVRATPKLVAVGGRTKPRLSQVDGSFTPLSLLGLRGISEYEPEEYTVTALAGTPVRELAETLATRGQYLPFDPLYLEAGATLGGTVASGANGPGRIRFGGVRDFILGARFVDGEGRLLRVGGKVVKNAAGFDLPKFLVGSLGRFGILAEITVKVFPRPAHHMTVRVEAAGPDAALQVLFEAGRACWDLDGLDIPPGGQSVCLRVAGPSAAIADIANTIHKRWGGEILDPAEAETLWRDLREGRWADSAGVLVKVPLLPTDIPPLASWTHSHAGALMHVSAGGNLAFISVPAIEACADLDKLLRARGLTGLTFRGQAPLWLGTRPFTQIASSVKSALDPLGRFPALSD